MLPRVPQPHTDESWGVMGTNRARLGGLVPLPCGSCHWGLGQGCCSYWHPSLGAVLLGFPRQV